MIQRALVKEPDNGAYLDSLGWIYYKKGMYGEALDRLKKAATLYKDAVIYEHLGDVYYEMEQWKSAQDNWTMSLEMAPDQEHIKKKLKKIKPLLEKK